MRVVKFMETTAGRWARVGLGVILIVLALLFGQLWLAIIGVLPILAASFNICVLAPFFNKPIHHIQRH